jgi:hypothetical protein
MVVVSLALAALHATHHARTTVEAWAYAAEQLEQAASSTCPATLDDGAERRVGLNAAWSERQVATRRERSLSIDLADSPLTHATRATLGVVSARVCP